MAVTTPDARPETGSETQREPAEGTNQHPAVVEGGGIEHPAQQPVEPSVPTAPEAEAFAVTADTVDPEPPNPDCEAETLDALTPVSSPSVVTPVIERPAAAPAEVPSAHPPVREVAGVAPPVLATGSAAPNDATAADLDAALGEALDVIRRLQARLRAQVLGRDEVIDLVLVALLSDGHVLLEDYPGSGKTTLAKTLGLSIVDDREDRANAAETEIVPFRRIQFTPDLLPSDVTGVSVFDANTSLFHFRHGPLFAHVVLADEINRTSPKVQAAMLEAMAEKQVTVDNVTHELDHLFFVIATQNPLDLAGTYPLPAPQLDRFLFKLRMDHIDRDAELRVLDTYRERRDVVRADLPRVGRGEVLAARRAVEDGVAIDPSIKSCLVDLSRNLREDDRVLQGNSTRSLVLILPALQAMAAVRGRDYVSADDVRVLAPRVLGHRVELAPGVSDFEEVLRDAMAEPLESLARRTLSRRTSERRSRS